MSELTIYYSVQNNGDGSATPKWFDTARLADWHADNDSEEGFGESTGELIVEGDNLTCSELLSKEGYFLTLIQEDCGDKAKKFQAKFFPKGLPSFTVKILDGWNFYYGIFVEERLVFKYYAYSEKKTSKTGMKKLQGKLNGLINTTKP